MIMQSLHGLLNILATLHHEDLMNSFSFLFCQAKNARCMACSKGVSVEEYCTGVRALSYRTPWIPCPLGCRAYTPKRTARAHGPLVTMPHNFPPGATAPGRDGNILAIMET